MRRWSKATRKSRSTSKSSTSPARKASLKGLPAPTPSEAAFEAAFAALDSLGSTSTETRRATPSEPCPQRAERVEGKGDTAALGEFVKSVFAKSDEYLRDRYATIADASRFHTKIAGVSFEGRQDIIAGLQAGAPLELRREPSNPHDANAIAIHYGNLQLGFLNKELAAHLAPLLDNGVRYRVRVASLTGGTQEKNRGVNVLLERETAGSIAKRRDGQRMLFDRSGDEAEIAESVRSALIGVYRPHDAQTAVLERIAAGKNTLAVFGTGRGKSFCFQYTAALRAFAAEGKTLVIYPLRALANDQHEALRRTLEPLGLRCFRANGSIENDEREDLFAALTEGSWDVVLATPEFLEFHRDALTGRSTPSFVVVDEAHHLAESRHRPAYARLGTTIAAFGAPQILALTATAGDDAFARIVEDLRIEAWEIDPTIRENLHVVDARGTKDKLGYLRELFGAAGSVEGHERSIIYCNSRSEATKVAKQLRKLLGDAVMFYHGSMPNSERLEIERLFREGALRVIVATSAFGEGIDLPDVRHVVLYHLNFDFGDFNQQAGRAGRDGAAARIHLLYGPHDRGLNEHLINLDAPSLPALRELYRSMKGLAHPSTGSGQAVLRGDNATIASHVDIERIQDRTIAAALRIFADSNLVEVGEDEGGRYVKFLPVRGRVDMERNERYAEGEATREAFARFANLALNAPAATLERIINRPIYPSRVALRR